jgi:RimJ/RimL family protein N-acetyltransferase
MKIRLLTSADESEFQTLRQKALRDHPTSFGSSYEDELEAPLSIASGPFFGAFLGNQLVGIAGLSRDMRMKRRHKVMLRSVYVLPEFIGKGIGAMLVKANLAYARDIPGVMQVNLIVNEANTAAVKIYEEAGFTAFGREENSLIVDGVPHVELHMVCSFHRSKRLELSPET